MRAVQSTTSGQLPQPVRAESVLMGRHDYTSTVLRLIGMEFYKIRRRAMSKVLSVISVISTLGVFAIFTVIALQTRSDISPLAQSVSESLRLPLSLYFVSEILLLLGEVLIVILAGVIVGGEYGFGTVRLMYTRGPTRTQLFLGKIGAIFLGIVIGVVGVTIIGLLAGSLLNLTTSYPQNFGFFSMGWLGHALLFLLIIMLDLFVYAMMAVCLSTLGRASAAGIVGALVWTFVVEQIVNLVAVIGNSIGGVTGAIFRALPDYTIGKNIISLVGHQATTVFGPAGVYLYGSPDTQESDLHALLVLAVYVVIFIGLAWWAIMRRDVTN